MGWLGGETHLSRLGRARILDRASMAIMKHMPTTMANHNVHIRIRMTAGSPFE